MYYSTHETSNTRFLVAKYIRDMRRLEPRNIGVVVWIDGMVAAHSLAKPRQTPTSSRLLEVLRFKVKRHTDNGCVTGDSKYLVPV